MVPRLDLGHSSGLEDGSVMPTRPAPDTNHVHPGFVCGARGRSLLVLKARSYCAKESPRGLACVVAMRWWQHALLLVTVLLVLVVLHALADKFGWDLGGIALAGWLIHVLWAHD